MRDVEDLVEKVLDGEDVSQQVEGLLKTKLKEALETLMEAERTAFLDEEAQAENKGNGHYRRRWETRYGAIDDLEVPRDRHGAFQTQTFAPYQRREDWLEELVIELYTRGVSTREVAGLLEHLYGSAYSPATVSRITEIAAEEIDAWRNRPLKRRYAVLYLDGMVIKLRRETVANEAVYLVCGVDEEGHRELLGFYLGGAESASVWREMLEDLKARGVEEVLLAVCDDLTGLRKQITEAFPRADVQPCVKHKVSRTLDKARRSDRDELATDLRKIYKAPDREVAWTYFERFRERWQERYPKLVRAWEADLDELLTFMTYPEPIWSVVYTTNWMERVIKELRKRVRPKGSFPTEDAAEKIIYLNAIELNDRWEQRSLRGFKAAREQLQRMFAERYPQPQTQDS